MFDKKNFLLKKNYSREREIKTCKRSELRRVSLSLYVDSKRSVPFDMLIIERVSGEVMFI